MIRKFVLGLVIVAAGTLGIILLVSQYLLDRKYGGGAVYLDAGPIGLAVGPNLTRGRGGVG